MDNRDGVARILESPRNYSAPDVADSIHRRVIRFIKFRRAEQSIDESIVEFDMLRRRAESKMEMGAGFLE